jgi:molecular chaperone GrpE
MSDKKNKWEKIAEEADRQEIIDSTEKKQSNKSKKTESGKKPEKKSVKDSGEASAADISAKSGDDDITAESELGVDFMDEFGADMLANAETIALRNDLDTAKKQVLEMMAKISNQEARAEREMKKARQFANEGMIKKLLPVLDSLTMGLDAATGKDNPEVDSLLKGMHLTNDMLLKVLQEFGVSIINPAIGDAFDPDLHEAMTLQSDENQADNTVLQTLQRGYSLQDRVLRAAMVVVNRLA